MKSLFDQPYKMLGHLAQIAEDAVKKELDKMADKEGIDLAYYEWVIKMKWGRLSSGFDEVLEEHEICKTVQK